MKRIVLFLATNLAVILLLSVILNLTGLHAAAGQSVTGLLLFSAVVGFTGSFVSLLLSKTMAKWSTGARVVTENDGPDARWLVQTVRTLAQRSTDAAREIKSLIEESVGRVEQGSRLVGEAGATMSRIVESVRETGTLIGEISRATQEQSAGVGLVNESVGELDGMTQQNAALVEQSAAAAISLKDQAERLAHAVGQFDLPLSRA
jgi:hypothetical protein